MTTVQEITPAPRRSIFAITDDLHALDDLLFEAGGDISDPRIEAAIHAWMEELDNDLQNKADNYAALIVEIEHRAAIRKEEANRLTQRAKLDQQHAAFLSSRLKSVFESWGIKKLKTARFRLGVVCNDGLQPLDIHGVVPAEWTKSEVVVTQDRDRIRRALEAGESLPFAVLQPRGTRLSIR